MQIMIWIFMKQNSVPWNIYWPPCILWPPKPSLRVHERRSHDHAAAWLNFRISKTTFDEYSFSCSASIPHERERPHNALTERIQVYIPLPSRPLHQECAGDSNHGEWSSPPPRRWHPTSWPPCSRSGEFVETFVSMEHVGCRWASSEALGPNPQQSRGSRMHVCRGQGPGQNLN